MGSARGAMPMEKRRSERYNVYLPVQFSTRDELGTETSGRGITVNISAIGAYLICSGGTPRPATRIGLTFLPLPGTAGGDPVTVAATVVNLVAVEGPGGGGEACVIVEFDRYINLRDLLGQGYASHLKLGSGRAAVRRSPSRNVGRSRPKRFPQSPASPAAWRGSP